MGKIIIQLDDQIKRIINPIEIKNAPKNVIKLGATDLGINSKKKIYTFSQ